MRRLLLLVFSTILISSLLISCSTPITRSKEKADSFSRLSLKDQRLVLEGRLKEGLSQDAVYIALGHPMRKSRGRFEGKNTLAWIYGRLESYEVARYRFDTIRGPHGEFYTRQVYDPITEFRSVETFVVYFDNGLVAGWQEL